MAVHKDFSLDTLSEEELLSEFVPSESAKLLLREYASLYNILLHTSDKRIGRIPGVGNAKLKKILCIREVMNRVQQERVRKITSITGPRDIMDVFRFLEDRQQEEFWVLLLNTKNVILHKQMVTQGTVNASLAGPREVFHAAVQYLAASVIVVHNHPSGDSDPSEEDKIVTKRIAESGRLLSIPLLDHVIIGRNKSVSLFEQYPQLWNT